MLNNSNDLLRYMAQNLQASDTFFINPQTIESAGLDNDTFQEFIDELVANGYVERYIRSVRITKDGFDCLM